MPDPQPWPVLPARQWAVTVDRDGDNILTIATSMVSGKPDLDEVDRETIRHCAQHLRAFVGEPEDARSADQAEIARLRQEMKRAWGRLANHLLDNRNDGLVWEAADIITAALIADAPKGQEPPA